MKVKFRKSHPAAVIPKYARIGDAGLDLTAVSMNETVDGEQITYDTGLCVEIPEGFVGLIFPRSSIFKKDLALTNSVCVIDSGYRGSLKAVFNVLKGNEFYSVGDRVCQLIIVPYPNIEPEEVSELSDSDRGSSGYGSTGK